MSRESACRHEHLSETFTWMNDLWRECLDCGHMDSPSWFRVLHEHAERDSTHEPVRADET